MTVPMTVMSPMPRMPVTQPVITTPPITTPPITTPMTAMSPMLRMPATQPMTAMSPMLRMPVTQPMTAITTPPMTAMSPMPRMPATQPVITTPPITAPMTAMSPMPRMPTTQPMPATQPTAVVVPTVQRTQPLPALTSPSPIVQLSSPPGSPVVFLPPMTQVQTITSPSVQMPTVQMPPGLPDIPTELPAITAPAPTTTDTTGQIFTGINMPMVPDVFPTQAIRFPSPTQIPPTQISPAQLTQAVQDVNYQKTGHGGLTIHTNLETLNQLRNEVNTAVNINPLANFQGKFPAGGDINLPPVTTVSLPPLPTITSPLPAFPTVNVSPGSPAVNITTQPPPTQPISGLPPLPQVTSPLPQIGIATPAAQPGVHLPNIQTQTIQPVTTALPTGTIHRQKMATQVTQPIRIPTVKATVPIPTGLPQIKLPKVTTVMRPIPLASPAATTQRPGTGLAVAYTPQQQVVQNIMNIDPKRLNPRRAKNNDGSYSVKQLKAIAGGLNVSKSGTKKELVDRIKAKILKINPNAFN